MIRLPYDPKTGEFKGLYETIGYLVVKGSPEEVFFNYRFNCEKSKVLYLHYRRRIPNSFTRTIFNRHRTMIESGVVDGDFSNIYFFLPVITNRLEEISQYLINVSFSPVDINQGQLDTWSGIKFDPSKLDLFGLEKSIMSDAVVKCLKQINNISNSNIVCNADGVLSRREVDVPVDWIRQNKQRVSPQEFKVSC